MPKIEEVCKSVLARVTPSKAERTRIKILTKKLENKVISASKELGAEMNVRVEGSVAKDTWLSCEPDIDIFMQVPTTIPRESLGRVCLRVARRATKGAKQVERFAEHPYLEAFLDDTRVNIVPCYDVKRGEWLSATDRTPYHTEYVRKHLTLSLRGEVRLLKRFMEGIGVYGAEIKVGGFSGYLCELLVIRYRTFVDTLRAFASSKQRMAIDIERYYEGRADELELLFKEPLVVVDPVDKGRNVSSAVQYEKLCTLVAASQEFLKNPSVQFFYPPKTRTLPGKALRSRFAKRGSTLVFVVFGKVEAVPDVLWGQLYKSQRSLRKLLEAHDFHVMRHAAWSDEQGLNVFLLELEQRVIPSVKRHLGPPLEKEKECEKFLAKHLNGLATVAGPYVEDGRWVVQLQRQYPDAVRLLEEKLKDGGRRAGVAEKLSRVVKRGFKICVNEEIASIYSKDCGFSGFLTEFLSGKPKWLQAD